MGQDLPATSYALLGLLSFGQEMSGYELKARADNTLRFYWVSPAMSQIYTELSRLARLGLVTERAAPGPGRRTTRMYGLSDAGHAELRRWLAESPVEFPMLKHSVALRLLLGHLVGDASIRAMLEDYLDSLAQRRAELAGVRERLGDDPAFRFPAYVAEWGLRYYDEERDVIFDLIKNLRA